MSKADKAAAARSYPDLFDAGAEALAMQNGRNVNQVRTELRYGTTPTAICKCVDCGERLEVITDPRGLFSTAPHRCTKGK